MICDFILPLFPGIVNPLAKKNSFYHISFYTNAYPYTGDYAMKEDCLLWQLGALTFTAVLGTLLHFLYDWTGCIAIAPFSAVNESTWEHMKILFFPMLFFAVIQSFFCKTISNFWQIKCAGILIGTALIPVTFYTLNGIFGKMADWPNITLFFLSAGIALTVEYFLFQKPRENTIPSAVCIAVLALVATSFLFFTFFPLKIPLFQDPRFRVYGIL